MQNLMLFEFHDSLLAVASDVHAMDSYSMLSLIASRIGDILVYLPCTLQYQLLVLWE